MLVTEVVAAFVAGLVLGVLLTLLAVSGYW